MPLFLNGSGDKSETFTSVPKEPFRQKKETFHIQ